MRRIQHPPRAAGRSRAGKKHTDCGRISARTTRRRCARYGGASHGLADDDNRSWPDRIRSRNAEQVVTRQKMAKKKRSVTGTDQDPAPKREEKTLWIRFQNLAPQRFASIRYRLRWADLLAASPAMPQQKSAAGFAGGIEAWFRAGSHRAPDRDGIASRGPTQDPAASPASGNMVASLLDEGLGDSDSAASTKDSGPPRSIVSYRRRGIISRARCGLLRPTNKAEGPTTCCGCR